MAQESARTAALVSLGSEAAAALPDPAAPTVISIRKGESSEKESHQKRAGFDALARALPSPSPSPLTGPYPEP